MGGYDDLAALDRKGELDGLLSAKAPVNADGGQHPLIIVGSGPAGYAAAIYAARAGLRPIIVAGAEVGGQLVNTTEVENWPGGPVALQGPQLMDALRAHAERVGATIVDDHIEKVDLSRRPFRITGQSKEYASDAMIVATGASPLLLGLPSESTFRGRGVSTCAVCDGYFYKGQKVAVIGGGNTAIEEALYLANIAAHVTLVHRRDVLRGEKVLQDRLFARVAEGRVTVLWDTVVEEVLGTEAGVTGLRLRSTRNDRELTLPTDGVFVAIGHSPNSALVSGQVAIENGYIKVVGGLGGRATATSVEGVFAAGDVADPIYRQAITSAASGAMAALDADRFLSMQPRFDRAAAA